MIKISAGKAQEIDNKSPRLGKIPISDTAKLCSSFEKQMLRHSALTTAVILAHKPSESLLTSGVRPGTKKGYFL